MNEWQMAIRFYTVTFLSYYKNRWHTFHILFLVIHWIYIHIHTYMRIYRLHAFSLWQKPINTLDFIYDDYIKCMLIWAGCGE